MKKTVTINISGIIFNIDEDAYTKLQDYLGTIKGFFRESEGRDEIMADIEARIAEMLQEKLSDKKQVVTIADIDAVIEVMGKPEAFIDEETAGPEEEKVYEAPGGRKRLFRDPDSQVLGGVCSGIGWYFGFDPIWLRLAFVIAVLFFGTGILLYIILWIIIPEAKTTAEKLEMKGKKVTVSNIGKAIEDEMEHLKTRFDKFQDKASAGMKKHTGKAGKTVDKIIDFMVNLFGLLVRAVGKVFAFFMVFLGIIFAFVLIAALFGKATYSITSEGVQFFSVGDLSEIIFASSDQALMACIGILLFIGTPVIAIIYGGLKLLLGIKHSVRGLGIGFASLWIIGLVICGFVTLQFASEFSVKAVAEKQFPIDQPRKDTLFVETGKDVFHLPPSERNDAHDLLIKTMDDKIYFGNLTFDIQRSRDDSFRLEMITRSRGETYKKAKYRAKMVNYSFKQQDSLLVLNPWFLVDKDLKWRLQKANVILQVPEGKSVHLGYKTDRILHDVKNVSNTWDRNMTGKTWTMTDQGLACLGCDEKDL